MCYCMPVWHDRLTICLGSNIVADVVDREVLHIWVTLITRQDKSTLSCVCLLKLKCDWNDAFSVATKTAAKSWYFTGSSLMLSE